MIFEHHIPSEPLNRFVADMVFYEGYVSPHDKEKLLPDGSVFMLFDMQDGPKKLFRNDDFSKFTLFRNSYISGQHKKFIHIEVTKESSMFVIRFKPGGAFPFLSFPLSAINNKVVQFEPVMDQIITQFRSELRMLKSPKEKFVFAEKFLLSIQKKDLTSFELLEPVVLALLENPEKFSTKELATKIGVSQKHLINLFSKQVGLNPKSLARILRFQKVLVTLESPERADWLQISTDCGYYDQAHFSKDFYDFSGINPSDYLNQRGDFMNYIPVK